MYWGSRKGRLEDGGLVNKTYPNNWGHNSIDKSKTILSTLIFIILHLSKVRYQFFICAWSEIDKNLQNYFLYLLNFYLVLASSLLLIPIQKKTGVIFPRLKPVFIFQVIFRKLLLYFHISIGNLLSWVADKLCILNYDIFTTCSDIKMSLSVLHYSIFRNTDFCDWRLQRYFIWSG